MKRGAPHDAHAHSAKQRSGYYGAPLSKPSKTDSRATTGESATVDISELVFSVLDAARRPGIMPLGSAFPSPLLFPLSRLAKSLGQAARSVSPWSTVVDLPPGNENLWRQIALRYMRVGISQPAEDIIITNGALEALNLCLMAVTQPGDIVAVESPGFYAALQAIERLGLCALEIPVDTATGLDLGALARALDKHAIRVCRFMTDFQNPTGVTLSAQKKEALVELLAKHEVPLIEDDVYGELHYAPHYPPPAIAFDRRGLVMHCGSFSKNLAPGPLFSASRAFENCIRLNYGHPWSARIDEAIRTLGELLVYPDVCAQSQSIDARGTKP